jgi:hypothetical protein
MIGATGEVPIVTMKDVIKKFRGNVTAINSDPTRVGELTLISGKKIFLYGGVDYISLNKQLMQIFEIIDLQVHP